MFHDMKSMTELFDRNILSEMQATDNPRIWIRMCDKVIIASGMKFNFAISSIFLFFCRKIFQLRSWELV